MADDTQPPAAADTVLNRWRKWLRPDPPAPAPAPPTPAPEPPTDPSVAQRIRAMLLLRQIDFKKLLPVFFTVPTLLFFAISGLIAWLGVLCGLFLSAVRGVIRLFWRK